MVAFRTSSSSSIIARSASTAAPAATPLSKTSSSSSFGDIRRSRKFRVLVAANGPKDVSYATAVVVRLKGPDIVVRAIADTITHRMSHEIIVMRNEHLVPLPRRCRGHHDEHETDDDPNLPDPEAAHDAEACEALRREAYDLTEWADILVLAPIDADHLAKMLAGITDTFLLEVLRSWNCLKKILLVPGMSTHTWDNTMTRWQLDELQAKWKWVRVMQPLLWQYVPDVPDASSAPGSLSTPTPRSRQALPRKRVVIWDGFNELVNAVKYEADMMFLGHDVETAAHPSRATASAPAAPLPRLPPEIWTLILQHTGDWELAQALGVYTNLPMPTQFGWRDSPSWPGDRAQTFAYELEWLLLSCDQRAIVKRMAADFPPELSQLSPLSVRLIIRFSLLDVLAYLEANRPAVFWTCFGQDALPKKASAVFGRTDVLDWWYRCKSIADKVYDHEAMDGASRNGFVHVLEWWRQHADPQTIRGGGSRAGTPRLEGTTADDPVEANGNKDGSPPATASGGQPRSLPPLTLKYTEAALENASARGQLVVLEWWLESGLPLRPGKSLIAAAQQGQLAVLRWWATSVGLRHVDHADGVCKAASASGQVRVLSLWRSLKDDDIGYDSQVLVQATRSRHVAVLEWWKRFSRETGKRVEYKTCDIEEALYDGIGDESEVRRWWQDNGLDLVHLPNKEWLKLRSL